MSGGPTRLALQTGDLDDHRRCITADHELWDDALRRFVDRDEIDSAQHDDAMRLLCERWPAREGPPAHVEALAVTVALATPFAARDRILEALVGYAAAPQLDGEREQAAILVSPWVVPRPRFPHIYDPDVEQRAPIVAILDGPRSPKVGELLDTAKKRDRTLADAIVLGADLETLELLDRLSLDATGAARWELAAKVDQDRARWRRRADQARARQRLEGSHYGWHSDNFPPGCLEAARAEQRRTVDVLLQQPAAPPG